MSKTRLIAFIATATFTLPALASDVDRLSWQAFR
jgi:hypothetical protein